MGYAQMLVPGFIVKAQANGNFYTYHTDDNGRAKRASKVDAATVAQISSEITGLIKGAFPNGQAPKSIALTGITPAEMTQGFGWHERTATVFTVEALVDGKTERYEGELGALRKPFQSGGSVW